MIVAIPITVPDEEILASVKQSLMSLRETAECKLVIFNDDPKDFGGDVLRGFADEYIRYDGMYFTNVALDFIANSSEEWGVYGCGHNLYQPNWLSFIEEEMRKDDVGIASIQGSSTNSVELFDEPQEQYMNGSLFGIKAEVIKKVGLYYPEIWGDADYRIRVMDAGYRILNIRKTFVTHEGFTTIYKRIPDADARVAEGHRKMTEKYKNRQTYGYYDSP